MKLESKTDAQIVKVNEKLAKMKLKTKAKKGDKNTDYVERLIKEINPAITLKDLEQ